MLLSNQLKFWQQHKLLVQLTLLTLLLVSVIFIFQEELYDKLILKNYIAIHLTIEFFIVFFSFAIAIQSWLGSMFNPHYRRVLVGSMFMMIGILEGVHTMSYSGMPFFLLDTDQNMSLWLSTIQRLLLPIGLIIIYSLRDRQASSKYSNTAFLVAIVVSAAIVLIAYAQVIELPKLLTATGGSTLLKNILHIAFIILQLVAIGVVIRKRKMISHNVPFIIVALMYLIFSECLYLFYSDLFDIFIFLAHVFHLASFVLLFFAIYYLQVRIPFVELKKVHHSLANSEKEMKKIAYYDAETGLKNEQFLKEDLSAYLLDKQPKALVIFSLERYTTIKASLGKGQVQNLIRLVSKRIEAELNNQYALYKLDTDRFAIYMDIFEDEVDIKKLAERLHRVMEEPFTMKHFSITTLLHIGVSMYPKDGLTGEELIQFAIFAMYEAQDNKKRIAFYNAAMQKARENRMLIEHDLKYAMNGQLFLEYQPQLDLKTGQITSMEALIRWRHPEKGIVSPLEFIPIAEESGLIIPIGQWVLETACRETVALQQSIGENINIAVNLSVAQLYQEGFIQIVERVLNDTGIQPANLQLEITESMTVNTQQIIPILKQLKKLGITIAVDDFGTGYSSLSYLKDFPLDELKIDRSFIRNILDNHHDAALVKMILSMAKHLQLKVVAEGIETNEQMQYLMQHRCDKIQGYYISKPISYEQLESNYASIQAIANESIKNVSQFE